MLRGVVLSELFSRSCRSCPCHENDVRIINCTIFSFQIINFRKYFLSYEDPSSKPFVNSRLVLFSYSSFVLHQISDSSSWTLMTQITTSTANFCTIIGIESFILHWGKRRKRIKELKADKNIKVNKRRQLMTFKRATARDFLSGNGIIN